MVEMRDTLFCFCKYNAHKNRLDCLGILTDELSRISSANEPGKAFKGFFRVSWNVYPKRQNGIQAFKDCKTSRNFLFLLQRC